MPVFSVRRDPRRGLSYVAILVLALLAGATPAIRPAQAADAAPATQYSAQAPMTADQAQQVLGVLNDPHKREEFTRTLTAIARGLPQAAPVPARASAPAAAPAPAAGNADVALEPNSLGSDVMSELAGVRDVTLHQAREFIGLFSDLVFVGHWIHSELSSPQSRQTLFDAFGRAGLIFILALAAERGLAIALRRPLSAVTARAVEAERQLNRSAEQETAEAAMPAPETEAEQAVQDTRRQDVRKQVETLRIIRRIPYSLLHLLTKLLPVALFLGIGYAGAAFVGDGEVTELVTLTLTNAYVAARAMYLVVEMIMVPKSPTIRLCGASDRTARIVTRWWNVLVAVPSIVVCLSSLGALFHLAPRGTEALIRAIVLAEHVMIAVFIWRIRKPVAMAMQPPARFRGRSFWSFVGHLAHFWWLPAMVFDLALWLVWAMHVRGGYTWIWRTTILTIVVILLSRVLSLLAFGLQNRVFHVSDEFEARYPGLQARADYYYPYARRGLSILLVFATLVILLQAWGIPAVAFFLYGALGTQIMTALVSIIIAFTIAIAVWEIANAALQNQIARYETTEQASRAIRLRTVLPIIRTVLLSVIIIIVAVTTLSQIGLNVAPLLTGAGIMGAAIAFGSQSLVKDFITGFFMLVENAMQVGDWVTAGGISGTVEHLSIRTLRLRTTSGDVHIIPFSSVTSIANTSRDYNVVVVTFMLDLSEDPDRVAAILADVVAGMRADPQFAPMILTDFAFLGVEKADGDGAKLVGSFRTTAGNKWKVSREYYRRLGLRMVAEGVKFPSPTAISLLGNTGGAPLRIQMVTPPAAANSNTQPPTDAPPRVPGGVPHPDTSQ
ncbi:MscS Mechanosensitive ion channel [Gluconacetobacter diazotrophicus PA1 5]|uniref:mechanosensitive ion channel domain-containing protein n=1 Tax=Gluconacetobacter diazotrophicus TaxID=33996 RepID=UPI000173D007|nr:mechanosensitive ion channel domain-containing protein [Gluconacetobacter diazotrophicus]ACI51007.1 MscS Mechanosensitive ion channel [Gluconacetobacter diazotrophicus PA1 5]